MDQIFPFHGPHLSPGDAAISHNPRNGVAGLLELHVVEPANAAVFLFRGELTEAECERAVKNADFRVAACTGSPGYIQVNGESEQFTVFSPAEAAYSGYVRIVEAVPMGCGCK